MSETLSMRKAAAQSRRGFWLRHLHRWHWISAALSLIGMMLFAATGITLNHAADIEAKPVVAERQAVLPPSMLRSLPPQAADKAPLPANVRDWLSKSLGIAAGDRQAEWSEDEIYLALPRPGGDAWLSIDRQTGDITYEQTDRGWVSYLNDLHKGRNAGPAWSWFIDIFAAACLVFTITGLFLLQFHAANRPATWPLVGFGLLVPLLLAILFIH